MVDFLDRGFESSSDRTYKELKLYHKDEIAVVALHRPKGEMNSLNASIISELDDALAWLTGQQTKGLILASENPIAFCVGVQVAALGSMDPDQTIGFIRAGQDMLVKLQTFPGQTACIVNGAALGGGLELAMACDGRVAANKRVNLGLPETAIGVIPCFGGTYNWPRLTSLDFAREFVPFSKTINVELANEVGLVDRTTPKGDLISAAEDLLTSLPPKKNEQLRPRSEFDIPGMLADGREYLKNNPPMAPADINVAPIAARIVDYLLDNLDQGDLMQALCREWAMIHYLPGTKDTEEGIRALLEKRKPIFNGS